MFELTVKTALVTGATVTIGATIARSLHGQGATVAISGTRREVLDRIGAELGDRVHILAANLADTAETEALVPRAEEAMGQLDILVANAGVTRYNLLVQLRDEDWEQVIAINLSATFRLSRAADAHPAGLTLDQQSEVRRWLLGLFRDIHRITQAAEDRGAALAPE